MKEPSKRLSGIIANKGEAKPAIAVSNHNGVADKVAVTVKLDEVRYRALKIYGLDNKMTNQDIIVKALDLMLNNN
jgi:hypothetical protein